MSESPVSLDRAPAGSAPGGWTCTTCGSRYPADFAVCPRDATPRSDQGRGGDPLIGTVLAHTYRIVDVLGEGGMAKLYRGEHLRIGASYALKVIHRDLAGDADLIARFEREARAAGRIHSEHVVRVVDVLRTDDGRPCIVTELLVGEDLQKLLDREDKLSVDRAIPIARQICRAVAAAHAVGVVHRDLKPSNVFLCPNPGGPPLVKVFDFGVAKLEDEGKLTRTDAVVGTAAYMAPEQARRAADAGPLSDLYSIGAVLYHMLAGEPPYGSAPALSRFALVLHEEPTRPRELEPSIPTGVEAVIQHAMARDTGTRVQTAAELDEELAAFEAPPAVEAGPSTAAPAAPPSATTPSASTSTSMPVQLIRPATPPAGIPTLTGVTTTGANATDIALRAALARPVAVLVAVGSSLAAGAWIALLLAAVVGLPLSGGERALIGLMAALATAGVAVLHVRTLRPKWRSTPAVERQIAPIRRGLLAGLAAFGAFEVLAYAMIAVLDAEPAWPKLRAVGAGLAAGVGLGWRRFGFDAWLRRRLE
jgi:serine/threonine protein kinase